MSLEELDLRTILLAPIEVDRNISGYKYEKGKIYSGIEYKPDNPDADMSSVAVDFYELIYADLLETIGGRILGNGGKPVNTNFMGDTMNSFNTIANRKGTGAGPSKDSRTPETEWEDYLKVYKEKYHCLANFWLIPMGVGRTPGSEWGKMKKAKDYPDRFLGVLNGNFKKYKEMYNDYFLKIDTIKKFCEINYLDDSYANIGPNDSVDIIDYSNSKNSPEIVISSMINMMEKRADKIAKKIEKDKFIKKFQTVSNP